MDEITGMVTEDCPDEPVEPIEPDLPPAPEPTPEPVEPVAPTDYCLMEDGTTSIVNSNMATADLTPPSALYEYGTA